MDFKRQPVAGHPLWVRASVDPDAFANEQDRLGTMWTLVALASDLPRDGDWVRTLLGGRSIFVQRFGSEIRAFENRCAHRFYPLRIEERGNGPIVCGFHHWRYDKDGRAVGIPMCTEMFGTTPRDLRAGLLRLELETCGSLIFARFPPDGTGETLRDFLAEGFAVIEALCSPRQAPFRFRQNVAAHWKFPHHISLDDYHIVAVHPKSFGKHGYLQPDRVQYARFGRHSVFQELEGEEAFATVRAKIAEGTYVPDHYMILNVFPNFLISQIRAVTLFGGAHYFVAVFRYMPVSASTSQVQVWLFPAPFSRPEPAVSRLLRPLLDRVLPPIVAFFARRVMMEDNAVNEGQQSVAHQVEGEQTLGAHERRIGWFEEAYADALAPVPADHTPAGTQTVSIP